MRDAHGRQIDYIRLSVTDRCNLRCTYCMAEEMELLKDKSEGPVAHVRQGIVVQLFNRHAVELVGAARGPVETTKDVHRRALAGAAGPHDSEVVPLLDGQIQLIQSFDFEIT